MKEKFAVLCRDVTLCRNDELSLKGVNVHVKRGHIYGLLGPSGCGKTTLLRAILGELQPQQGRISVMGLPPGPSANRNVGYMPQEDALCDLFTVRETLQFFGKLQGLTEIDIRKRILFVAELLDLRLNAKVAGLSGGQRRCVSLAVAMLHGPSLLILDEPTVGLDPLLARTIWQHLARLTAESATTIIVTTHYIEDANGADMVALMSDGRILVEQPPAALKAFYGLSSLEDVLYEVCWRGDSVKMNSTISRLDHFDSDIEVIGSSVTAVAKQDHRWRPSSRRLGTLLFRERCSFLRHPGTILYKCVFPLITLSIFFYVMDCELPDLPVAVVDLDQSPRSQLVTELLKLQNHIEVLKLNSTDAARRLRQLKVSGVLTLPKNFTESDQKASIEVEPINPYFRSLVETAVRDTFRNPLVSPGNYAMASAIRLRKFGSVDEKENRFFNKVYHRVVAQLSFGPSMLASVTHVFISVRDAFTHRTKFSGATTPELVMSFFISQGVLVLVQTFLLVLYLAYKVGYIVGLAAWSLVYGLLVGVGFSGISLSLLVCSECPVFTSALYLALLLNVVTFMMCGEIWPREGMHPFLREYIAPLWPISYPADAVGVILFQHRWLEDRLVKLALASIALWVCVPPLVVAALGRVRRNSVF